jgi:tetratricopeptide (TPR) repeat protein
VARAAWQLGAHSKARRLAEESLAIQQTLGDQRGIAGSFWLLGAIALSQGELEEAERLMRESNAIYQEMGHQADVATGLGDLGSMLLLLGKYAEARSLLEKSVVIYSDLGHRTGMVEFSTARLGFAKMHLGQYEQARIQGQRVLTRAREHGRRRSIGRARGLLGSVSLAEKAYAKARDSLQESVSLCWDTRHVGWANLSTQVNASTKRCRPPLASGPLGRSRTHYPR